MSVRRLVPAVLLAAVAGCTPTVAPPSSPPTPTAPTDDWAAVPLHQPGDRHGLGPVRVRIERVALGRAKFTSDFGREERETNEPVLQVAAVVENTDPNRIVQYLSWGVGNRSGRLEDRIASDEFGNAYNWASDNLHAMQFVGQTLLKELRPGESIHDVFTFEPPVETATELRLTLSGRNVGQSGEVRVRIPRSAWTP